MQVRATTKGLLIPVLAHKKAREALEERRPKNCHHHQLAMSRARIERVPAETLNLSNRVQVRTIRYGSL
jgi:hypothetical protein